MRKLISVFVILTVFSICSASQLKAQFLNFPFNDTMTTPFGPAFADVFFPPEDQTTLMLPCEGGPIALCYYSGPEPETCVLTPDGKAANCECFEIAYGKYFVLITAILNLDIYNETIEVCGTDGSNCTTTNSAPVCKAINDGTFIPATDMISTFSFACVPEETIGCTDCTESQLYAGCMTAPCTRTEVAGIIDCLCPTFDGPFQIGLNNQSCSLGNDLVWSAAYNPDGCATSGSSTIPIPPEGGCIPDAPEEAGGCPLLTEGNIPDPPDNIDCDTVCEEYSSCVDATSGVEIGFTCDAVLCTSTCQDNNLVGDACNGLQSSSCSTSEIIKLEEEVGCSCCASQICGCEANSETEQEIFTLNEQQRDLGITPQCDINDTLCGKPSSGTSESGCSLSPTKSKPGLPIYQLIFGLILIRRFIKQS